MSGSRRFPPQPPIKFAADAISIARAGSELCDNLRKKIDYLISTFTLTNATFDNVLKVLLQQENEMQLTANLITMYSLVSPDASLRVAASKSSGKIMHAEIDRKANRELFRLVDAVYRRQNGDGSLDSESRKALIEERRNYIRKGMALPLVDSDGSLAVNARRLESIVTQYMKNLDGRDHSLWLTRQELAGVPEDALSGLQVGTGDLAGKLRLDLNGSEARWFPTMASSSVTREKLYLATRQMVGANGLI